MQTLLVIHSIDNLHNLENKTYETKVIMDLNDTTSKLAMESSISFTRHLLYINDGKLTI